MCASEFSLVLRRHDVVPAAPSWEHFCMTGIFVSYVLSISCVVSTLFDVCHCRSILPHWNTFVRPVWLSIVFAIRESFGRKETIYLHAHMF